MERKPQNESNLHEQILALAEHGTTVAEVAKALGMTRHNAFAWLKKLTAQRWLIAEGTEEISKDSTFRAQRQDNYQAHDPFGLVKSRENNT
jgi:transposase-like protein